MKKLLTPIILFSLLIGSSYLAQAQKGFALRTAVTHGNLENVERLIKEGADVHGWGANKLTAMHLAAQYGKGRTDILKALIDAGADVDTWDGQRYTPLMHAVLFYAGKIEPIKVLVDAGADVNAANKKGETALFHAKRKHHNDIVELFEKTLENKATATKTKPKLSFFSTEELKEMYKEAIKDNDDENISLIEAELTNRTKTSETATVETAEYRGGGDPLKGLNVSKAKEQMKIGNYHALIIGIDNYKGAWSPLKNAVGDAKAIESMLRTKYRFDHITTLYNELSTRQNIMRKLQKLVDEVKENDNVFIYYSGHGEFKKDLNKGYWVPVEAQTTETFEFISNSEIQTFLSGIKSKHTLLISDACFSGDIFRGNTISVPFEESSKYYNKVHTLKSRQAFSSGGIEPVMDGGRDGHSVFTYYLLEMLKRNEANYYDAGQLYNDMKIPVTNNSEQTPMLQPIKNTGDEGGQFIFLKKTATD